MTADLLEIQRLNRLYSALSQINQAVVRTPTRDELFGKVCHVLVEQGGFGMAWIGWLDPQTHSLRPLAHAGDEAGYLRSVEADADGPTQDRSPTATAMRENRPDICNDLFEDRTRLPWRAELARRGFFASAVFPIQASGIVGGTLSVYADRPGGFREKEIALLAEAAADVSFAVDNLAREEARERAQGAVTKSEERYRTTFDTMLEGCQLLGFDWRYLYLNPAAAIQNRRPNAELFGRAMADAWPGIEGSNVFALLRRCMEGRVHVHSEVEFMFVDGSTGWFDVRAQPVPEGIFVLSIDISERVRAERALRELNETLERKVMERTHELDAARERAEAADQIKSSFFATMSHELRTPLNSILGFTGIVLGGLAGPLNPEQAKQLGVVQGSARHLLNLINDVLDLSKIEAGQLELRCVPFDLRTSIERVCALVMPLAEAKGLVLRVAVPEILDQIDSDARRVEQILLNLFNNAIKFTDRGEVTLTVDVLDGCMQPGDGDAPAAVRVRLADTGIGMREEDLSRLFEPYRQIDSLQRRREGTGLGLAICRRLTGLLGGSIDAQSVWGQGSVFTLTLPMKQAPPPEVDP